MTRQFHFKTSKLCTWCKYLLHKLQHALSRSPVSLLSNTPYISIHENPLTKKPDIPPQHAHNNAQQALSTCPPRSQSSCLLFSTLFIITLASHPLTHFNPKEIREGKQGKKKEELTSQPHILRQNLHLLRLPQLRTQLTAPPQNILTKLLIPLSAPIIVLARAA